MLDCVIRIQLRLWRLEKLPYKDQVITSAWNGQSLFRLFYSCQTVLLWIASDCDFKANLCKYKRIYIFNFNCNVWFLQVATLWFSTLCGFLCLEMWTSILFSWGDFCLILQREEGGVLLMQDLTLQDCRKCEVFVRMYAPLRAVTWQIFHSESSWMTNWKFHFSCSYETLWFSNGREKKTWRIYQGEFLYFNFWVLFFQMKRFIFLQTEAVQRDFYGVIFCIFI